MRASAAISGITAAPMPFVLAALLLGHRVIEDNGWGVPGKSWLPGRDNLEG